jgi:hypothetical protein
MSAFVQWRLLGYATLALIVGFASTKAILATHESGSKGGVDNAMLQARALMTELQVKGWDSFEIDPDLLRLPDQDYASLASRRSESSDSFVLPRGFFEEYDDIAFLCDTFVVHDFERVAGTEGSVSVTGFYIVGWKSGAINTYDVKDVRMHQLQERDSRIPVFPGMPEYHESLAMMAGVPRPGTADDIE